MKFKIASCLFVLSMIFTSWIYWGSDIKVEQALTSKEWQSKIIAFVTDNHNNKLIGPLRRVEVNSNVKYLPNKTYIRVSTMKIFADDKTNSSIINISETGQWDISDNYLLVFPTDFKDTSAANSQDFSVEQLNLITQIFKLDAEQSRRIDIINEKSLLLTSLNHGSNVLFSN